MEKAAVVLKKLGIGERECKAYLILLRSGAATATKISKETGVDRTTTYDVLNRLMSKGIVSYVIKDNKKHFSAVDPKKLLKDLREMEEELREIMPDLIALTKIEKEKTNVEVFGGKEGIKTVLKLVLEDKEDYMIIGAGHTFCKLLPIFMHKFLAEATELNMKGRIIVEEGFGEHEEDIIGKKEVYKIISKEFTSTTTKIWGNKTAFFVFTEPYYTILIESKEVADRHRLYFNYLWKLAKEPSKENKIRTLLKK